MRWSQFYRTVLTLDTHQSRRNILDIGHDPKDWFDYSKIGGIKYYFIQKTKMFLSCNNCITIKDMNADDQTCHSFIYAWFSWILAALHCEWEQSNIGYNAAIQYFNQAVKKTFIPGGPSLLTKEELQSSLDTTLVNTIQRNQTKTTLTSLSLPCYIWKQLCLPHKCAPREECYQVFHFNSQEFMKSSHNTESSCQWYHFKWTW